MLRRLSLTLITALYESNILMLRPLSLTLITALTAYFAKQIISNALGDIGETKILKKNDLIKSYKMIKGNVDPSRHFLRMKQKVAHNYGLPIDYLRSSETEFDFLFDLLFNQKFTATPKPIFQYR